MRYLPNSDADRQAMLAACGLSSLEDLYKHVPANALIREPLRIPPGMSEYEITAYFREKAAKMAHGYASFLGAGVYAHYRPVLCDVIVQRWEKFTGRKAERVGSNAVAEEKAATRVAAGSKA
ncbi:MAG: hypothetical protein ACK4K6_09000 [Pseudarthrobacter sp.]